MYRLTSLAACLALLIGAFGCTQSAETDGHGHDHDHSGAVGVIEPPQPPSPEGKAFVIDETPENVVGVIEAREDAGDGDEIAMSGRIGGAESPWIEGRAAFTLVDASITSCEKIPGDNCPTPWDYCCRTDKLPASSALVKIVDDSGQTVKTDARKLLGVRELTEVTVVGKAKRDDAGNLILLARKIHVHKEDLQ